jgi:hypothetical protein
VRTPPARAVLGTGLALVLAGTAGLALGGTEDADGTSLRGRFADGEVELELEDRNVEPAVCFILEHEGLDDGDTVATRVLDRAGVVVLQLGSGDQVVESSASGCEIPLDDGYRAVFADPGSYVVETRVVEEQGTPPTPVLRSGRLERD